MPAVLVAGPTVTQNSLFLFQRWTKPSPVLIAPTRKGMSGMTKYWDGRPELDMDWIHPWRKLDWVSKNGPMSNSVVDPTKVVTNLSTRRKLTLRVC